MLYVQTGSLSSYFSYYMIALQYNQPTVTCVLHIDMALSLNRIAWFEIVVSGVLTSQVLRSVN